MAQSLNAEVEYVCPATWFRGVGVYGKAMAGDRALEFYEDRNVENYVQIPWEEIDHIAADVALGGKWIPRFEVRTKRSGTFRFSAGKGTKPLLRACRGHLSEDRLVRAPSFGQRIARCIRGGKS